jgi:hypothetical protein
VALAIDFEARRRAHEPLVAGVSGFLEARTRAAMAHQTGTTEAIQESRFSPRKAARI